MQTLIENKEPEYALLSRHIRNGFTEEMHLGLFLEYKDGKIIEKKGNDNNYPFFHRSCMKPMQLAALTEIFEKFDFTPEEIAVSTASHAGEEFHIETIQNILKKIGLTKENLLCPVQEPLNNAAKKELIKKNKQPEKIHNNCSGKHAAMLAYCVLKGYSINNYNTLQHPIQQHILKYTAKLCKTEIKKCQISRDGCTLPVIATPLSNLAEGFLTVFTEKKYEKIKNAVLKYPYYFGGHERTDSEIIAAGNNNLIAKVGAGNICCVVDLQEKSCYVIKLTDGDNFARGLILTDILQKKGKLLDYQNSVLNKMFPHNICDETNTKVGEITVIYP